MVDFDKQLSIWNYSAADIWLKDYLRVCKEKSFMSKIKWFKQKHNCNLISESVNNTNLSVLSHSPLKDLRM